MAELSGFLWTKNTTDQKCPGRLDQGIELIHIFYPIENTDYINSTKVGLRFPDQDIC